MRDDIKKCKTTIMEERTASSIIRPKRSAQRRRRLITAVRNS